jgi:membrane fusion protein, multidrug efflux system
MYAKVELPLKNMGNALMVPTEAVIPILKGQQVYLCKDGLAQPQRVETGVRTDSTVQITNGLQPGDTVITTGIMQLKPNSKITITSVM